MSPRFSHDNRIVTELIRDIRAMSNKPRNAKTTANQTLKTHVGSNASISEAVSNNNIATEMCDGLSNNDVMAMRITNSITKII